MAITKKVGEFMGMKIVQADWMPKGEVWITNNEKEIQDFNTEFKKMRGSNQYVKKGKMITRFKDRIQDVRRVGVLKNLEDQNGN